MDPIQSLWSSYSVVLEESLLNYRERGVRRADVGSGQAEKAIDLIAARQKRTGMH